MDAKHGELDPTGRTVWFNNGHFTHALLLAMPLPPGVSSRLERIQTLVARATALEAEPQEVVQAVRELGEAVRHGGISDGVALAIEVCEYVLLHLQSPRLSICLFTFELWREDMRLAVDGPPAIVMCNSRPLVEASVPNDALETLATTAQRLSSVRTEDLKALGDDECLAVVQVVALHAQFGFHLERKSKHDLRLAYLRNTGLEVWKAAVEALSEDAKRVGTFPQSYGRPALRHIRSVLLQAARGEVVASPKDAELHEAVPDGYHRILLEEIPVGSDREEKAQFEKYKSLSRPLPLAKVPALDHLLYAEDRLLGEFPWARDAIVAAFRELMARSALGSKRLGFSPLLFVGPPGLGKSRLARRLGEELAVFLLPIPFGSASDSHLINGVSRGWSTAQASPIVSLMLTHMTPSLIILADEIDKASGHYGNSVSPHSSLLSLLEPETARSWVDQFLQARLDLTSLMYIATANGIESIPAPLLNRFTVLQFSKPDPQDLLRAVGGVLDDIAKEWHVSRDRLPALTGADLEGPFGDMRDVRRAVLRAIADRVNPRPGRKSIVH